jgi:glycosyltransferase involved in cell wall biosynthesis
MKIAWVTPRLLRSAIGRESMTITAGLAARGHHVTLIGSEWQKPEEPLHPTVLPSLHWSDVAVERLRADFDLVVVNFGDNHPFHGGAFALLDHAPCLGIFHDFYLHNLFRGWLHARNLGSAAATHALVTTYGEGIRDLIEGRGLDDLDLTELAARAPMTEWIASRCAGALAHAEFYVGRLEAGCPGPIGVADLPVAPRGVSPLRPRIGGDLVALTVGVMNPNKCVDLVIRAIANSATLRQRLRYRLVGPIEVAERERLEGLAQTLDYGGLTIVGAVDDASLTLELEKADIVCCLRKPILEGASGSAIEGLLSGRPTLVADAGFYGGLPDRVVAKAPADLPVEAIERTLEALAVDEPGRRRLGEAARAWATSTFHLDRYLDVLERLMPATMAAAPVLDVGTAIGCELRQLGLRADDAVVGRIGGIMDELFGGPRRAARLRSGLDGDIGRACDLSA